MPPADALDHHARTLLHDALDRHGWTLLHDALDAPRLTRLRAAFDDPTNSGTEHVRLTEHTPHLAEWHALAAHPLALAAATHVLGPEFHLQTVHGRNPRPGHGQQGLHVDWRPRAQNEPFQVLTALWLLDDFTAENGATRLVPGTHRLPHPVPRDYAQPHAHHPDERIITAPAGAVLLINGHLWHSGRQNNSKGPRRAAQMALLRGPSPP